MKQRILMMLVLAAFVSSVAAFGQLTSREDAIWARMTSSTITLDGKLSEAAWASAESCRVQLGVSSGRPGTGWVHENGVTPATDPIDATIKFLVKGDSLYIAMVMKDKSVGAGLWAHNDALLMNLRYPNPTGVAGSPTRDWNTQQNYECYYGWVSEGWADTNTAVVGALPAFLGWAGSAYVYPRPDTLKAIWDAATVVHGTSNDDATADTNWTVELCFNLTNWGYKVQQAGGDIIMWNVDIWDNDYQWPLDTLTQSSNRAWLQGPWGNASAYGHMRIFARNDVTTSSGPVPAVSEDFSVPTAGAFASPTIDGKLSERVWTSAPSLQVKYGSAAIRSAYPQSLKYRSGQSQFTVNGATNPVLDPSLASVKYFVKNDTLFLGFDVADKFVQSVDDAGRYDGFNVIFNDRVALDPGDHNAIRRNLSFRVDSAGATKRMADLVIGTGSWDSLGANVRVKIALKGGTTVDTVGASPDSGYSAEMAIDLTKLGYSHGLNDGQAFFSIIFWDGDSFSGGSYGTKTWLGRPGDWDDGPALFYINQASVLAVDGAREGVVPAEFALLGNYPNPFNPSTNIKFVVPQQSEIALDVYDVIGRLVASKSLGVRQAGDHTVSFDASGLASGTYIYRLKMAATGATLIGKMMLLK